MENTKLNSRSFRRYNWLPDAVDARDFLYSLKVTAPKKLPPQVDLRSKCSPVFDQGQIGSCTANALAGAFEFLEKEGIDRLTPSRFSHASRLFIYYNERSLEGTVDQDAGAQLRDGIKSLAKMGVCKEATWKYEQTLVFKKPSDQAYTEAQSHTISQYLKISNLDELKDSLANGFPVAFGFTVYESFESPEVAQTGIMPIPSPQERALGGHAVLAVGYDDTKKALWVRNSWGPEWGQGGYFLMPYAIITDLKLAQDFWAIHQ